MADSVFSGHDTEAAQDIEVEAARRCNILCRRLSLGQMAMPFYDLLHSACPYNCAQDGGDGIV